MIKICDLSVSQLFLFKEQSHLGRCNVVYNDHGIDFHEFSEEQRNAFMADVAKLEKQLLPLLVLTKLIMAPMQIPFRICTCT
ncbi:MAG: hypothetical protein RL308_232 [Bacteroidota bacterium]